VDEVHPIMAMESYALSKQVDEATAAMISRRYGMTIIALRFPYTALREAVVSRAAKVREAPQSAAAELWAYLDVADAAAAIQAALEAPADGCHVVNVTAPDTLASSPTMELMKSFHPSTLIKVPLPGRSTAYDLDRMSNLLRFQPSSVGIAT
jgi:nucleoside-diphosphate-sugar epimerase